MKRPVLFQVEFQKCLEYCDGGKRGIEYVTARKTKKNGPEL
jgi:hypothetical protein